MTLVRRELQPFEGITVNLEGIVSAVGEYICLERVVFWGTAKDNKLGLNMPASNLPVIDHVWIAKYERTLLRSAVGDTIMLVGAGIMKYYRGWTIDSTKIQCFAVRKPTGIAEAYYPRTCTSVLTSVREHQRNGEGLLVLNDIWEPELRQSLSFALNRIEPRKLLSLLEDLPTDWMVNQEEILRDWILQHRVRSRATEYLIPLFVRTLRRIGDGKIGARSSWKCSGTAA